MLSARSEPGDRHAAIVGVGVIIAQAHAKVAPQRVVLDDHQQVFALVVPVVPLQWRVHDFHPREAAPRLALIDDGEGPAYDGLTAPPTPRSPAPGHRTLPVFITEAKAV
jgi:hypothetical protein